MERVHHNFIASYMKLIFFLIGGNFHGIEYCYFTIISGRRGKYTSSCIIN